MCQKRPQHTPVYILSHHEIGRLITSPVCSIDGKPKKARAVSLSDIWIPCYEYSAITMDLDNWDSLASSYLGTYLSRYMLSFYCNWASNPPLLLQITTSTVNAFQIAAHAFSSAITLPHHHTRFSLSGINHAGSLPFAISAQLKSDEDIPYSSSRAPTCANHPDKATTR